jgi:hypothetical protein
VSGRFQPTSVTTVVRRQHLVEGVVADEGDERDTPDEERVQVAELRPRLNHLRQAQLRPLCRMERHEERAEGTAKEDRDGHPDEVAAKRHTDESGRDGC